MDQEEIIQIALQAALSAAPACGSSQARAQRKAIEKKVRAGLAGKRLPGIADLARPPAAAPALDPDAPDLMPKQLRTAREMELARLDAVDAASAQMAAWNAERASMMETGDGAWVTALLATYNHEYNADDAFQEWLVEHCQAVAYPEAPQPMDFWQDFPRVMRNVKLVYATTATYERNQRTFVRMYGKLAYALVVRSGGSVPEAALVDTHALDEFECKTIFHEVCDLLGGLEPGELRVRMLDGVLWPAGEDDSIDGDEAGDADSEHELQEEAIFEQQEEQIVPPGRLCSMAEAQVIDLWTMTKNILRGGAQVVHGEMRLGKSFAILAQAMLGRFFSIPTIVVECHVKAAVTELVRNLNRGVTDPEYLVRAEAMDNRRLDQLLLLAESRKAVCTGRLVTVFHRTHTSLDQATRLRRTLDLTGVHLIYDEGNTLMTTSGTSKRPTRRELASRQLEEFERFRSGTSPCVSVISYVSATQFAVMAHLIWARVDRIWFAMTDVELRRQAGYLGVERVQPLLDDKQQPMYFEETEKYGWGECFGVDSPKVVAAIQEYLDMSDATGGDTTLLLSLGYRYEGEGGTRSQVSAIRRRFKADAGRMVFVVANGSKGPQVFGAGHNGPALDDAGNTARTVEDALSLLLATHLRVIVLGQLCLTRGVNVAALERRRQVSRMILLPAASFNLSNFFQLLGRCCGKHAYPDARALMKASDFAAMQQIAEFTEACLRYLEEGKKLSDEEYRTHLLALLSTKRPFAINKIFQPDGALLQTQHREQLELEVEQEAQKLHGAERAAQPTERSGTGATAWALK